MSARPYFGLVAFSFGPGKPVNFGELYLLGSVIEPGVQLQLLRVIRHSKVQALAPAAQLHFAPFILRRSAEWTPKKRWFDSPNGITCTWTDERFYDYVAAHTDDSPAILSLFPKGSA